MLNYKCLWIHKQIYHDFSGNIFFYMGLSCKSSAKQKDSSRASECKALCRNLRTVLPIGCLTTENSREAWQVSCLVQVAAFPASWIAVSWSTLFHHWEATGQLMLTQSKLGNEDQVLQSLAAAITSCCSLVDVSCKQAQRNDASHVCPSRTPLINMRGVLSQHQTLTE